MGWVEEVFKGSKISLRMCMACRENKQKEKLIRVVKQKDGSIFIDKTGKADGRGAYVCNNLECLNLLKKKRGLERSFRCKVDGLIYDDLKKEMI